MSDFLAEWQEMLATGRKYKKELDKLKQELASLKDNPRMVQAIQKRKKIRRNLQEKINHSILRIQLKQDLIKGIGPIIENVIENGAEEHLAGLRRDLKVEISELESLKLRLNTLDDPYRKERKRLRRAVREISSQLDEHRLLEMQWLTMDRAHLNWALGQVELVHYNGKDLIRQYVLRFPGEDVSDLLPSKTTVPEIGIGKSYRKKKHKPRKTSLLPQETVPEPDSEDSWSFRIILKKDDLGKLLPTDKEEFKKELQAALVGTDCGGLNAGVAYDKLVLVSEMSKVERSRMKQVHYRDALAGWKSCRAGIKYRLFLLIDEDERCIRFLPKHRRRSFSSH